MCDSNTRSTPTQEDYREESINAGPTWEHDSMEGREVRRRDYLLHQCAAFSLMFAVYLSRQGSRAKGIGEYRKFVLQTDQLTRIHIPCEFNGLRGLIVLYEATSPYPRASQLLPNMPSVQAYCTEQLQGHVSFTSTSSSVSSNARYLSQIVGADLKGNCGQIVKFIWELILNLIFSVAR